jgi:flagellar assembly protein FliH
LRILEAPEHTMPAFADAPRPAADPLAQAVEHALEQGRDEGYRRAASELEAERQAWAAATAKTLTHLSELEDTLTRGHDREVTEVILAAASRIVRQRIEDGDPVAARALREALDALPSSTSLSARVHPQDLELLARELQPEIERGRVQLVADASLSRGGCVAESGVGTVNATLETAEESVRGALLGESA